MDTLQDRVIPSVNDSGTCEKSGTPLTQVRSPGVHGWTYFVQRSDGAIKIGFSIRPERRICGLAREFGPLDTLTVVPACIIGEYETHQLFAHLRLEGEWFKPAPELFYFIEQAKVDALKEPEALKPIPASRPKPPISAILDVRRALIAKRVSEKADSKLGHTYSNLIELLENREKVEPGSFAAQHLPGLIAFQMKRMETLSQRNPQ